MRITSCKSGILLVSIAISLSLGTISHADVSARHGQLQSVIEAINDPDPLMRLAQLEDILKRGNPTDIQLAIRTAFGVDDPNVRSLALRTHFASFSHFIVTADFPDKIKQIMDGKEEKAKEHLKNTSSNYINFLSNIGLQFVFQATHPETNMLEFDITSLNNNSRGTNFENYSGKGNIRGSLLTLISNVKFGQNNNEAVLCSFEFSDYDSFTIKGTASCDITGGFAFPVVLHLFDNDVSSMDLN